MFDKIKIHGKFFLNKDDMYLFILNILFGLSFIVIGIINYVISK
jgi:hypothetical protein